MSDMRLKYLKTKMYFAFYIFLLCITAASVFGQSVELHGILGESVKFPAAVKKGGSLMYSSVTIGDVTSGSFTRSRSKFSSRLQWDSSTGLFSLSGLKMEDSGEYKVQNTDQNINTVFQLNVYIPVSKPHLSVTRNEYRCTILCAAAGGTGATLTLYKNGEKKPYVTSPVRSHPHLDMTVPVESGTYTCEAKNTVSSETSDPLTVEAHCTALVDPAALVNPILWIPIAVVVVILLVAIVAYVLWRRFCRIKRKILDSRTKHLIIDDSRTKHLIIDGIERELQSKTMPPDTQYDSVYLDKDTLGKTMPPDTQYGLRGPAKGKNELEEKKEIPPPPN